VIGGLTDLSQLASSHAVSEIVLPAHESLPCSDIEFRGQCRDAQLQLLKLGLYSADTDSR
jgi:hypothetical protein